MSREWESNPRPTVYDTAALPAELSRQEKNSSEVYIIFKYFSIHEYVGAVFKVLT